ncbi:MAG: hypothetical protein MZV70_77305 [Desulfobacterales bacterium]|nr:hypothetical protein [Desulfobacterales bacterium]
MSLDHSVRADPGRRASRPSTSSSRVTLTARSRRCADSLEKLSTKEIKVWRHPQERRSRSRRPMLCSPPRSKALIIGFHLSPNTKIRELARREGVDIRTYRIIYEAVDAMRSAMEGMLKPEIRETILATVEVRQGVQGFQGGTIAGRCYVATGTVVRATSRRGSSGTTSWSSSREISAA